MSGTLAVAAATAAIACGGGTSTRLPTQPSEPSGAAGRAAAITTTAAGDNQSASGDAHISLSDGDERLSFNAVKRGGGDVTGEFELSTEQFGGVRLHGVVTCMAIPDAFPNRARVGGTITQSTSADYPVGTPMYWTVIDNGEGANDPPDQFSDLYRERIGPDDRHCVNGTTLPFFTVTAGNIQVRP